jgi:hypothetical protein
LILGDRWTSIVIRWLVDGEYLVQLRSFSVWYLVQSAGLEPRQTKLNYTRRSILRITTKNPMGGKADDPAVSQSVSHEEKEQQQKNDGVCH